MVKQIFSRFFISFDFCLKQVVSGNGGFESNAGPMNVINKQQQHQQQQQQSQQPTCLVQQSGVNYSYVQFSAVREPVKMLDEQRQDTIQADLESYPITDEPISLINDDMKRESCVSIKKQYPTDITTQSHKELVHTKRVRCR